MNNQKGFTLVEMMVVVAIIGIITAISIPYYNNYKKTSCDQAALADLYNVKAAVQKKATDDMNTGGTVANDTATLTANLALIVADTSGQYGWPGPTKRCAVAMANTGTKASASTPQGTVQGVKGWSLDMAGGAGPVPN